MVILLVLLAIALFVAVVVVKQNRERDAALRASAERARLVAEDAAGVVPPAAQPKAKTRVRR